MLYIFFLFVFLNSLAVLAPIRFWKEAYLSALRRKCDRFPILFGFTTTVTRSILNIKNPYCTSRALLLLLVMVNVGARPAESAAPESPGEACRPALFKDVLSYISNDQQRFSYFSQIEEKTFERMKAETSAHAAIPLIRLGDMVDILKASANYKQFSEKRREYFQRVGYTQDNAREVRDLQIVTSPVEYRAWARCMEAFAKDRQTVVIYKNQEDSKAVHVVIRNGTPVTVKLWSDLLNARVSSQDKGKAFKDGTHLEAGGSLPILLQRNGMEALKLSIRTDPAFSGLFIESEWGSVQKSKLKGTLQIAFGSSRIEDRGQKRGDTWDTPDLHDKKCGQAPCTRDSKWQMANGTLRIIAAQGRKLRNPRVICDADNQGACAWANEAATAKCTVEEGGNRASCAVTTGSRSHRIVIVADEYEIIVENNSRIVEQPVLLFEGSQFTLRVPNKAKGAILEYQTPSGSGALKPGEQSSFEGRIVLLGRSDAPEASYFTYRVN